MLTTLKLDWNAIRDHYDIRFDIHQTLHHLLETEQRQEFAELLLGISDPLANCSAAQYHSGPIILAENHNAVDRVWDFALELLEVNSGREVPQLVHAANLSYLQISIGSEASCLLSPDICWVTNSRTIWTQLFYKHREFEKANQELKLYRTGDSSSEMAYAIWTEIHLILQPAMLSIATEGSSLARHWGVEPGPSTYLWADCIASALHEHYYKT